MRSAAAADAESRTGRRLDTPPDGPQPPEYVDEAGVPGRLLMAKSRHGSVKTLNPYAKPTFAAVAEVTAHLDPVRRRGAPR